jgi:hypothetical protein
MTSLSGVEASGYRRSGRSRLHGYDAPGDFLKPKPIYLDCGNARSG